MGNAARTGKFDPAVCPLLAGLTPEEQKALMERDARLRACIAAVNGDAQYDDPGVCKMARAYASCRRKAEGAAPAAM